jgi:hypothetical protein
MSYLPPAPVKTKVVVAAQQQPVTNIHPLRLCGYPPRCQVSRLQKVRMTDLTHRTSITISFQQGLPENSLRPNLIPTPQSHTLIHLPNMSSLIPASRNKRPQTLNKGPGMCGAIR